MAKDFKLSTIINFFKKNQCFIFLKLSLVFSAQFMLINFVQEQLLKRIICLQIWFWLLAQWDNIYMFKKFKAKPSLQG